MGWNPHPLKTKKGGPASRLSIVAMRERNSKGTCFDIPTERFSMRIQRDSVLISSILFTLALLWLAPHNLQYAATWRQFFIPVGRVSVQNYWMRIGFASLTLIVIGLIITWKYYIRRERWAWLVMFVIVWVFAFPVYVLPIIQARTAAGTMDWSVFADAARGSVAASASTKSLIDFFLLLIALLLPVRAFFAKQSQG